MPNTFQALDMLGAHIVDADIVSWRSPDRRRAVGQRHASAIATTLRLDHQTAQLPKDLLGLGRVTQLETANHARCNTICNTRGVHGDRKDFAAYRVRRGHRRYAVEIIP
jgi:hypothetical protein